MTGLGEDVYTPPRADVDAMVEAAAIAAIGADRYDALPDEEDYRYRKENAEAEYWSKSEARDTFRAALESLGIPLSVLAAIRAGTWRAVPVEPSLAQCEAGYQVSAIAGASYHAMVLAAPKTPEEAQ